MNKRGKHDLPSPNKSLFYKSSPDPHELVPPFILISLSLSKSGIFLYPMHINYRSNRVLDEL